MARLRFHGDPAQFGEAVDASLATEFAIARRLGAAEGHLRFVMHGRAVDVADARLDLTRDVQAACRVAGKDRGGEAIFSVVGKDDGVRFVAGADDADDRAETFVAKQLHVRGDAVDDMGGHQHAAAFV